MTIPPPDEPDNFPEFRGSFTINSIHESSVRTLAGIAGVEVQPGREGRVGAGLVRVIGEKRNQDDFDDYALELATQMEKILTHPDAAAAIRDIDWCTVGVTLFPNDDMNASFIAPPLLLSLVLKHDMDLIFWAL